MDQKKREPEFFVNLKDGRYVGKSRDAVEMLYPNGLLIESYPEGTIAIINKEQDWLVHVSPSGSVQTEKWSVFKKKVDALRQKAS